MVALIAMLSLFLTGILDIGETLAGFSNPTVIMIAALLLLAKGFPELGGPPWQGSFCEMGA